LQQAAAALAAGDLVRADHLSREVLERAPRHPRALQMAAAVRLQQDDGAGAGELLRQALVGDPDNSQLLEGMGVAALKAGKHGEAESWLRRALSTGGTSDATLTWLGLALSSQGRSTEAVDIFRQAAAGAPDNPGAHLNLAHELTRVGNWKGAAASYERVLELDPDDADALNGLGVALLDLGKGRDAAECLRRAVLRDPDNADYHANLGHALFEQQLWWEAAACYERALTLRPDDPEALNSLGSTLLEQGNPEEAVRMIRRAIDLRTGYAEGHANLGKALLALGREEEAKSSFEQAVALQPEAAARHLARFAGALLDQGWHDEALPQFVRALKLSPELAEAQWGLATAKLYRMEFEDAWTGYERRFEVRSFRNQHVRAAPASMTAFDSLPRWRGPAEATVGRVAIWAEQGIGDQVLFSTLIPELTRAGVALVYEMDPRLMGPYQRAFPGVRFVARQEPPREELQRADRVLRAGTLPGMFRRSREEFARQPTKLLTALPERVAEVRQRLATLGPGLKVALSWRSTRKDWWVTGKKNALLADLASLLRVSGMHFVDVQYGDTADERHAVQAATGARIARFEDVDHFNDLEGVLAILEACDLLITTSNATAHFAGALGKWTWLLYLADRAPFHYWAHGGTHRCLWYPSVEIVTAPHLADWASLVEHVRERLDRELMQLGRGQDGSAPRASGR